MRGGASLPYTCTMLGFAFGGVVMGRLAAQAVLQCNYPLGKLRGHVHGLHGVPAIITYDAAYLLRNPLEKAKAWEDLCLALEVSRRTP